MIIECAYTHSCKGIPKFLRAEVTAFAVYVLNRVVNHKDRVELPYEMYTGKTPDLSNLKIFGYINIPKLFRRKFDSKAQKEMWDLKAIQEM